MMKYEVKWNNGTEEISFFATALTLGHKQLYCKWLYNQMIANDQLMNNDPEDHQKFRKVLAADPPAWDTYADPAVYASLNKIAGNRQYMRILFEIPVAKMSDSQMDAWVKSKENPPDQPESDLQIAMRMVRESADPKPKPG